MGNFQVGRFSLYVDVEPVTTQVKISDMEYPITKDHNQIPFTTPLETFHLNSEARSEY